MTTTNDQEDILLKYLVRRVEETGMGYWVTLCVNGLIVTGGMIRSRLYYDKISSFITEPTTNDQLEIKTHHDYMEDYKQFVKKQQDVKNTDEYIHLHHVKIYTSDLLSQSFPADVWRGKLSAIDGYSIGIAEVGEEQEEVNTTPP